MIIKTEMKKGLRALDVGLFYLHGSRTGGRARTDSDIDLAVMFTRRPDQGRIPKIHPRLCDLFLAEFSAEKTGDVDIAYLQDASLEFQFQVVAEGRLLFESDPGVRVDYVESLIKQHLDFRPIAAQFSADPEKNEQLTLQLLDAFQVGTGDCGRQSERRGA